MIIRSGLVAFCRISTISVAFLALSASVVHAQAALSFSGGSGTRLTASLAAPVTYTITQTVLATPFFTFDGASPSYLSSPFTDQWSYSVNGGTPHLLVSISSGFAGADTTADDLAVSPSTGVFFNAGDIVTLNAATITTFANISVAAPRSGSYATFIGDIHGNRISNVVGVVPEAGTTVLTLPALGMIGFVLVRRYKKKA